MKLNMLPIILVVMNKFKNLLVLSLFFISIGHSANSSSVKYVSKRKSEKFVSIHAKGIEVKDLIYDLFTQTYEEFVLDKVPSVPVFLSVKNLKFKKALSLICDLSNLNYKFMDGVYYIYSKNTNLDKTLLRRNFSQDTEDRNISPLSTLEESDAPKVIFDEVIPPPLDVPLPESTVFIPYEENDKDNPKKKLNEDSKSKSIAASLKKDSESHSIEKKEIEKKNNKVHSNTKLEIHKKPGKVKDSKKKIIDRKKNIPAKKLTKKELHKAVTVKLNKVRLAEVFQEITKQSKVKIELSPNVKSVRMDAHLIRKRVKDAVELICRRLGLKYELTQHFTILVSPKK